MITLKNYDRTPRLAELKVSYKRGRRRGDALPAARLTLDSARKAEAYLRGVWDEDTIDLREEFIVVCLNQSLEVLGWVRLHTGGLAMSPVDPRLVFAVALQTASAALLVAHNHPSGDVEPSEDDKALTRRLADGARLLGLRFLDHLILSREGSYSIQEAGRVAG